MSKQKWYKTHLRVPLRQDDSGVLCSSYVSLSLVYGKKKILSVLGNLTCFFLMCVTVKVQTRVNSNVSWQILELRPYVPPETKWYRSDP